jgi:hypothetical protein
MPAAKKKTSRSAKKSGITRREVEAATKRFDKALDDATSALQTMGANFGRGAKSTYREVERALQTLRRDAQKANRTVIKDLEKVWAAAGSASPTSRSRGKSATKPARSKSTSKRSKSSTAKSSKAAKSSSTRKRASSGSRSS